MTAQPYGLVDDDNSEYIEYLELRITQLETEVAEAVQRIDRFTRQTQLLMGAVLQQRAPQVIIDLLTGQYPELNTSETCVDCETCEGCEDCEVCVERQNSASSESDGHQD